MTNNDTQKHLQVVVIGGGTGIFPVTTALKHFKAVDVATIIAVSDSGGSTGRIRDEFGFQPVGDLRQSLAALAEDSNQEWIRRLLLYRFEKGNGLKGHNLGNLILTALQDMTGSTSEALYRAQQIFRLDGTVIPATTENVNLKIVYKNGDEVVGEHTLDEKNDHPQPIDHVELIPNAPINPYAAKAIREADLIIIGPGDYYASIMAALSPDQTETAFTETSAKILYITNLMTRLTQTKDMTARQHTEGIEKAIGRPVDMVLINNQTIPEPMASIYAGEGEHPIVDDFGDDSRVIRAEVISPDVFKPSNSDTAHRSLLRHDSQQLEQVLGNILHQL